MACALESNVHGKGVGQREEPAAQRPQSIPGEALDLQTLWPGLCTHALTVTGHPGRRCDLGQQLSQTEQPPERDLATHCWPPLSLAEQEGVIQV